MIWLIIPLALLILIGWAMLDDEQQMRDDDG
jgi:hypothetical protein